MNCNKGDLAVVVSSQSELNIGLFVQVVRLWRPGDGGVDEMMDEGVLWHCKAKGRIRYEALSGEVVFLDEGPIPDHSLRPIRPGRGKRERDVATVRKISQLA